MNKIIVALATAALSFNLFAASAATFGRIVDLKGEGFISYKGKTHEIKKGDAIEVGAEIVIEHHGQVTFTDNADHRFHLGNASSAVAGANSLELRAGDLWFQSLNKNDAYKIKSANAEVEYMGGEAILSYDTMKGKTQLMVINSMMKLSNLRAPELNLSIAEGHFSFIDNAYDEGAPRDPTPVGQKTYSDLVAQFSGISPMDKNSAEIFKDHKSDVAPVARSVASVKEEKVGKDDIDPKMLDDYKAGLLNKTHSKKLVTNKNEEAKIGKVWKAEKPSKLVVHIYGRTTATASIEKGARSRAPASVLELEVPKTEDALKNAPPAPYSKDYKNQYKESDKLIDDLKKL